MNYLANLDLNGNFKILQFNDDMASVVYHRPNVIEPIENTGVLDTIKIYGIIKIYHEESPIDALVEYKTIKSLSGFLGHDKEKELMSLLKK